MEEELRLAGSLLLNRKKWFSCS